MPRPRTEISAVLPEFGSVTNPIDATGAMFDDPTHPAEAARRDGERSRPADHRDDRECARPRRTTGCAGSPHAIADAARSSGRTIVAYQVSPLGAARRRSVTTPACRRRAAAARHHQQRWARCKHLPQRRDVSAARAGAASCTQRHGARLAPAGDFLAHAASAWLSAAFPSSMRRLASSAGRGGRAFRQFGRPVALKAEAPGLLHKSDLGCVRLNCATESEVADGLSRGRRECAQGRLSRRRRARAADDGGRRRSLRRHHRRSALSVRRSCSASAESSSRSARTRRPRWRRCRTTTRCAMIHRIKAAPLLLGARGRPRGDIEALAASPGASQPTSRWRMPAHSARSISIRSSSRPTGEGVVRSTSRSTTQSTSPPNPRGHR